MKNKPFVIGISGGTCSGKSTLSVKLKETLSAQHNVTVLHLDRYYVPTFPTIAPFTGIEYPEHNHPSCMNLEWIHKDLDAALIDLNCEIVIIEGLFALYFDCIRDKLDLRVFVDLMADERMFRRIKRWVDKQPMEEIAARYLDTVRYRHAEFIEPTRWHADVVINGTLDTNLGTKVLVSYIKSQISEVKKCKPNV